MRHVVCYSGGKDSTALVLWARENLVEFDAVFCDTGWEHAITYAYITEINLALLGGKLIYIKGRKYFREEPNGGFVQLCVDKKRVPSAKARFCTEKLKVLPMIEFLKTIDDEVTVYQGIRADESESRSRMLARQWSDDYDAWIERPLLRWTAEDCFALAKKHGIKPNPLYLMGAGRVGCFPCVMVNQRELKAYLGGTLGEELKRRIRDLEKLVGRSFFEPTYIPARFCTGVDEQTCAVCGGEGVGYEYQDKLDGEMFDELHADVPENMVPPRFEVQTTCRTCGGIGKTRVPFPWADDVFRYLESTDENQLPLLPSRSCMSVYNLCE